MLKGIVCDVGHVVTRGSVLNHILRKIGREDAASLLYDPAALETGSQEHFDAAVRSTMSRKIQALRGLGRSDLRSFLEDVPLTEDLVGFVQFAGRAGIRLAFVGAVPAPITTMLLERALPSLDGLEIVGSSIVWHNDRVVDAGWVCTPQEKHEALVNWMSRRALTRAETAYIGDSIGDLPAMAALPKGNRIALNAENPSVLCAVGRAFEKSFKPVIACLRADFSLPRAA